MHHHKTANWYNRVEQFEVVRCKNVGCKMLIMMYDWPGTRAAAGPERNQLTNCVVIAPGRQMVNTTNTTTTRPAQDRQLH